ncbi:MAG TPA: hypothetical protein VLC09_04685 [Polyangiaceae bacterium]|nr:hypothetical protein [Polyangiaceae bacterium]
MRAIFSFGWWRVAALHSRRLAAASLLTFTASGALLGCGAAATGEAAWPPAAKKWFDRAEFSFQNGDLEDARHAADNALKSLPDEVKAKLLVARIALAQLEYDRAVQVLTNIPGAEASAIRGRAYWYGGDIERAADELEALTRDPEVHDAWAKEVAQLARLGRGRRPFEMSGGLVAATEMPRVGSTAMIVPLEVNGEATLAMIATDSAEAAIDSKDGQGQWVSLRFGGRLEVSDVPAVARDLSGIKRQTGAPIKMLIGVNLLRHLRATIDFSGSQFVVRNYEAPPPPEATTVHPVFYRGGALVIGAAFGVETSAPTASLLVNTSMAYPVALDEAGWKKAGQDPATFAVVPGGGKLTYGSVPLLRLGAFEVPNVPGVLGAPVDELEKATGANLDGFAGSGLWATFRLTFADQGRTLFIEDLPPEVVEARIAASQRMRAADEQRAVQGGAGSSPAAPPQSAPSSMPPGAAP